MKKMTNNKDETFDYVIFSEVIEHLVTNINLPIKECKRMLKLNGTLIITTPNACELGKRLLFLLGKKIYFDLKYFYSRNIYDRHNREFTMKELLYLMKGHRLKINKKIYLSSWEGLRNIEKNNLLAKIVSNFQKLVPSFRSNMMVVAQKQK